MKTVILCPYELNVDGVVNYYALGDALEIRYSLNFEDENRVAVLWGLSSKKPYGIPCKIDIPLVKSGRAEGVKRICEKSLGSVGYNISDIDTFALVCKSPIGLCIAALGFGGLSWNITHSIDRLLNEREDYVLDKCRTKLMDIRRTTAKTIGYATVTAGLEDAKSKLEKSFDAPLKDYSWYIYSKDLFPFNISIYKHLTHTEEFQKAYQNSGICLLGIKDMCHTVLAMKSTYNPFVNAEDVCIYAGGYWIAGVGLLSEGQFFEKPSK